MRFATSALTGCERLHHFGLLGGRQADELAMLRPNLPRPRITADLPLVDLSGGLVGVGIDDLLQILWAVRRTIAWRETSSRR